MSLVLLIVLSVLAVWRASHMLYDESGPLGVFERIHAWAKRNSGGYGQLYDLLNCFYCIATLFSMIPAYFLATDLKTFILYVLAISGSASILQIIVARIDSSD